MADTIRIAMVARDLPPRIGGIPTHVKGLVDGLTKVGVEVEAFQGGGDIGTLFVAAGRRANSSHFDVLHVQSTPYGAFAKKHPLVITAHSPVAEERKFYKGLNTWKAWFAYRLEKKALEKADAVIAVSRATLQLLSDDYGVPAEKLRLIPNGVDCEKFKPGEKRGQRPPKILVCSRLDPRKNIGEALEALSKVKAQYQLEVIGDGPERQRLEKTARSLGVQASFLGKVPEPDLVRKFSEADVFLSTSHSEGFGLSLLQAMASGSASLVSDVPAHRELVEHMKDGVVHSTPEELVDHLELLLSDPALVERLGRSAREKAQGYSWEKVAESTAKLYRELLERGASTSSR